VPAEHRRRSIYTFARRNLRHPLFELFDRPDAQASCSRRNESTTAPQALTMLNCDFVNATAAALATTLTSKHGSEADPILTEATRICLSRQATQNELNAGRLFLEKQTALAGSFAEAVQDDIRPLARECQRHAQADAAGGAGDESDADLIHGRDFC
jgi:hypothetical protein